MTDCFKSNVTMKQNKKPQCPQCGQAKFPFRYNKCHECGYMFSDMFFNSEETHKGPGWNMAIEEFEGLK